MVDYHTDVTGQNKNYSEDTLKRIVFNKAGVAVSELKLVKHPKMKNGWYAVHEALKKAWQIFPEIEEVEIAPIEKIPGYEPNIQIKKK